MKGIDISVEKSDNFLDNEEVINSEEISDESANEENIENGEVKHSYKVEGEESSPVNVLRAILDENYPATNIMFEGLVDTELKGNNIVFVLDEEHMPMSVSMNYFVNKALKELEEKIHKTYSVKFVPEAGEKNKVNDNSHTIEKLKELFPYGKLNIKERK